MNYNTLTVLAVAIQARSRLWCTPHVGESFLDRAEMWLTTLERAKRLTRIVLGFTVLALGVALLVLPGPEFCSSPAAS